jgi:hypothetical protein
MVPMRTMPTGKWTAGKLSEEKLVRSRAGRAFEEL